MNYCGKFSHFGISNTFMHTLYIDMALTLVHMASAFGSLALTLNLEFKPELSCMYAQCCWVETYDPTLGR